MNLEDARSAIERELGSLAHGVETRKAGVVVRCAAEAVHEVAQRLREGSVACDYLTFLTAVDYPNDPEQQGHMELWYHFRSLKKGVSVLVTAPIPRDGESVRTISDLFPAADWHERECYDLLGVVFAGHPALSRILLPDHWHGHPLRKDYDDSLNDLFYTPENRWPEVAEARRPETGTTAEKRATKGDES